MLLRLYDNAFRSDAMVIEITQPLPKLIAQNLAGFEIKAKVNRGSDFIDVLPAGALRADGRELYFFHRYVNAVGDVQAVYHSSHTVASCSGRFEKPPGRDHLLAG